MTVSTVPRPVIRMTAQCGIVALGGVQHVEAGALVDVDIGDDDGVGLAAEALDGFAGGGDRIHVVAAGFERRLDGELQRRIVFDQE